METVTKDTLKMTTMTKPQTRTEVQKAQPAEKEVRFIPFGAADEISLSIRIIQNVVAVPTKTNKTCSDRDAIRFLMMCQAQRLNPFAGDAYLIGYDKREGNTTVPTFSLITAVQVFYKRAETCAEYEGIESGIILLMEDGSTMEREGDFCLPNEEVVGGWAAVSRKGRKAMKSKLSIEAMRPPYDTPFWSKAKAPGQICKCAEADALRRSFPTLLGWLYLQGEMDAAANQIVSKVISRPLFEPARQIAPTTEQPETGTDGDLGPQSSGSSSPNSESGAGTKPEPEKREPKSSIGPISEDVESKERRLVKAVKFLLNASPHSELDLLQFLRHTGRIDESLSSVVEIGKMNISALEWVHNNWRSTCEEMTKLKGKPL